VKVLAITFEEGMLLDVEDDIEIAGRATVDTGFALPGVADAGTVFDAGWNLDVDGALFGLAAFAAAALARMVNDGTTTLAGAASARDGKKTLLIANLATAAAAAAGLRGMAGGDAGAATLGTEFVALYRDFFFDAEDGLIEFELEVFTKIGAALRPGATAAAAEQVAHSEKAAEDVAEVGKILEDGRVEADTATGATDAGVTVTIVSGALLGIGEDGIRLGHFLELFFRDGGVARIAVRMVLERELAVSALDFLVGSRTGDAQNLVVIAFTVVSQSRFSPKPDRGYLRGWVATRTMAGRSSLSLSL
jgi:hypothetical protein